MEKYLINIIRKHKIKIILYLILMAVGIICHGYMFLNKLPNYDEVLAIAHKGTTYGLGRWFLPFTAIVTDSFSIPLFAGTFSLTMIIFASFMVCGMLEISGEIWLLAVGSLMVCFPTVAGTFTFMYTADSYFIALLFSVMSIYLVTQRPIWKYCLGKAYAVRNVGILVRGGNWLDLSLAVILLVLSLGIYQAYYQVAAILAVLVSMKYLIKYETREFIRQTVKLFFLLLLSMVVYLIVNQIALAITGSSFSATDVDRVFRNFPNAAVSSYKNIIGLFFSDIAGVSYGRILQFCWFLSVLIAVIVYLFVVIKKKKNMFLALMLLASIPIASNLMIFFMNTRGMDTLIIYSYVFVLIMPISTLKDMDNGGWGGISSRNSLKSFMLILVCACVWKYMIQINRAYVGMDLAKTQALSYYTTMITQIKSLEGYTSDMPVCLLGDHSQDASMSMFYPYTANIRGTMSLDSYVSMYSRKHFINIYCGFFPDWYEETDVLSDNVTVQEMSCYPDDGSIRIVDGVVVVKIE